MLVEQGLFDGSRQLIAAAKDDKRLRLAVMAAAGCRVFDCFIAYRMARGRNPAKPRLSPTVNRARNDRYQIGKRLVTALFFS